MLETPHKDHPHVKDNLKTLGNNFNNLNGRNPCDKFLKHTFEPQKFGAIDVIAQLREADAGQGQCHRLTWSRPVYGQHRW